MSVLGDIIGAGVGFGASFIGGQRRLRERDEARSAYEDALAAYTQQDITNPYEDLTVSTEAADFAAREQRQGLADTLAATRQAAGGSGIAALAQSLANVQSRNIQTASADIARQEARNEQLAAAGELQRQRRVGDLLATQLGMSQVNLAGAEQAIRQAQAARSMFGGQLAAVGGQAAGDEIDDFMTNRSEQQDQEFRETLAERNEEFNAEVLNQRNKLMENAGLTGSSGRLPVNITPNEREELLNIILGL